MDMSHTSSIIRHSPEWTSEHERKENKLAGSGAILFAILVLVSVLAQQATAEPTCRPTGKYLTANPRDCRSYYYCFEGKPYYGVCGAGHQFDESRQSCLQSTVSECFSCPSSGIYNLPHPTSCQKFVMCFQGVANERVCPTGLLFNEKLRQCDLSGNVVC
ncbi:protein obstructor-E-like [Anopheles moucheti]|uniref:protein obstructor-E-like n=1 Tax=Anopheles moucheti TaxID=186751 RepID=UPI0022F008FD|nr:protein obstructor-E-like [Anopheles moucheti]